MTAASILIVGFLLGMRHATEADHLAAMATLASRQASVGQAVREGVAWGIGHTLTLMAFGGTLVVLGQAVSPRLASLLEAAVGAMLVLLGVDVLRRLRRDRVHFHLHRHADGAAHVHAHGHAGDGPHAVSAHAHAHAPRRWPLRALAVGTMHGLAGSAALVALSVGAAPSALAGLAYVAVFGAGSILGMAALSAAIAWPLRASSGYLGHLRGVSTAAVGVFSCGLGAWTLWAHSAAT